MFSMKLCSNRSCNELMSIIRRNISKTSVKKNSDALSTMQNGKMQHSNLEVTCEKNVNYASWIRQMKSNNRSLSTAYQAVFETPQFNSFAYKAEFRDFMAMFPDIITDLTNTGGDTELSELMERFAKVIEYNTPTGKKHRPMILISSYKLLEDPEKQTPENMRLVNIVGWCIELMQGCFIIYDDIVDESETRRGEACWHHQPNIGLTAINDAGLLESAVYILLRKYFRDHPAYVFLMELFHKVIYNTSQGQSLDIMYVEPNRKPSLETFTMNKFNALAKYKTAYYTFHIPTAAAMYLVGIFDEEQHRQAETVIFDLGHFYQVENDFLDCFGDAGATGKKGTDIEVGKCTWLAVEALQRATPAQRKIMEEHYGRPEPDSAETIRSLYRDLDIPNLYYTYEEESFNNIKKHIQQIPKGPLHNLLLKMVGQIYNREC